MTEPATSKRFEQSAVIPARRPAHHAHPVQLLYATESLISMIVVALFILTFVAQPFRIPSASMEPALLVGDFLLVNKMDDGAAAPPSANLSKALAYRPIGHGDIIVFRYPPDPKIHVVKRVIAVPGDLIRLQKDVVYLNGQPQHEPYIASNTTVRDNSGDQFPVSLSTEPRMDPKWAVQLAHGIHDGQYLVPAESYFVMGDNRGDSRDSRYWGLVPRQNIVGSPFLIYFSFRQESLEDVSSLPDDKLDHQKDDSYSVQSFARWDRMFRVVR